MKKTLKVLSIFVVFALLAGCSLAKLAGAGAKAGKGTAVVTKGAAGAGAVAVADDVAKVASHGDEVFRVGAVTEGATAAKADDLAFVVDDLEVVASGSNKVSEELLQGPEFADWVDLSLQTISATTEEEEAVPDEVTTALKKAVPSGQPLSAASPIGKNHWGQWYRLEQGDRVAVCETATGTVVLVKPQPKAKPVPTGTP